MGCDIHLVLEKKYADRWVGVWSDNYAWPQRGYEAREHEPLFKFGYRNYRFFGALAGVRCEGPDPLGLPNNASDLTRMLSEGWDGDGHSHSYCSLRDFVSKRLIADSEDNAAELMRQKIEGSDELIIEHIKFDVDEGSLDDFRMVFWFDN